MPDDVTYHPSLLAAIVDAASKAASHQARYLTTRDREAQIACRWWNRHLDNLIRQQELAQRGAAA